MRHNFWKIFASIIICYLNLMLFSVITLAEPTTQNTPNINSWQQEIRFVLSDQKFNYAHPLTWWAKLLVKIKRILNKLKLTYKPKVSNRNWFDQILQILGLVLLVLALFFFPRQLLQREKKFPKKAKPKTVLPQPELLSDQKAHALELAAAGDYREAIRYLYLANLVHLKKNALLPEGIKLSDQENLKAIKKSFNSTDPIYLAFFSLMNLFQEKWYGLKTCQFEDYTLALESFNTILENTGKNR